MSAQRLSVLFTSSWYPSAKDPVLGNFVKRHAEAVATLHETWVVYVTSAPAGFGETPLQYTVENQVHTVRLYYNRGLFPAANRWRAFTKAVRFALKKKGSGFDVVHHNMIWPDGWQPWLLKRRWGTPFIVSENWTGFDIDERGYPGEKVVRGSRLYAAAASFLCPVTDNLAKSMRRLGLKKGNPDDYRIVPNVVDTETFALSDPPKGPPFRFLHVSSLLDQHKNVSGLLRTFKKALELQPDLHLTIAGDGLAEPHVRYAATLKIPASNLTFLGTQNTAGVVNLMHECHAFILFSNYENLPCVILEAMSCGRPVIATDVGGVREHLFPEHGYLIQKRDEKALLEAMIACAVQKRIFDPHQLRAYAVDHFSVQAVALQFDQLYREALNSIRRD